MQEHVCGIVHVYVCVWECFGVQMCDVCECMRVCFGSQMLLCVSTEGVCSDVCYKWVAKSMWFNWFEDGKEAKGMLVQKKSLLAKKEHILKSG